MDRYRKAWRDELDRLRSPQRVEVPGSELPAPPRHRQQCDVRTAQLAHLWEQVGVPGEVQPQVVALDEITDRLAGGPEWLAPATVRRGHLGHGDGADDVALPDAHRYDVSEVASPQEPGSRRRCEHHAVVPEQ